MPRLLHAWLDCFTFPKLGAVVCAPRVLLVVDVCWWCYYYYCYCCYFIVIVIVLLLLIIIIISIIIIGIVIISIVVIIIIIAIIIPIIIIINIIIIIVIAVIRIIVVVIIIVIALLLLWPNTFRLHHCSSDNYYRIVSLQVERDWEIWHPCDLHMMFNYSYHTGWWFFLTLHNELIIGLCTAKCPYK